MKIGHAAALALVGWNLLLPPLNDGKPDLSAPLSTWEQWHAFDTADLCEQNRAFKADQMRKYDNAKTKWSEMFGVYSQCISTDDPRLKP